MIDLHLSGHRYQNRLTVNPFTIIVMSMVLIATALLAGCGGSTDPRVANPASSPAPVSEPTQAQGSSPNSPSAELEAAVQGYLSRNTSMPYKDVSVKVLSQDDAYATVEVHAMLRPDAEKPWDEQVRTLQFALVSGQWKVSKTDSFASVAGLATATAQAQIAAATATAGMEARFQSDARGANLSAVHMLSATEGWALGENVMLHYTGGEWVPQRIPDTMPGGRVHGTQGLRDIYMLSANDGWIVGGDPASNGAIEYNVAFILHYDGTQWSTVGELPEAGKGYTLTAIDMVSPTEGWAVGNNTILHYTTASTGGSTGAGGGMGTWEKVKSPGDGNYALYDIKMVSADEGWATGRSGIMLHYKGGTWSQVESNVHDHMYTLAVVSSSDVWALGDYGHTTHYDGTAWTEPNLALNWSNNLQFRGASFSSPADGWAVDKWGGRFLHFSNGKWQELEESLSPKRNNSRAEGLYGIFMLSAEEGWAVGAEGLVLHYIDGKWTEFKR